MTNLPSRRVGDRYRCFLVVREDKGYGGPYGQYPRPVIWECEDCGRRIHGEGGWAQARMADHHECGHAPCARCGAKLLRRKDGTPRQHPHTRCPGKNGGDKIAREFVKHMTAREYA
jgi:hypothetical protein